jgi:hypothetical protein
MQIVVLAIQFKDGEWKEYRHTCSNAEIEAVIDSTSAKVLERFHLRTPNHTDYLAAASYLFNIARGSGDQPMEGDRQVLEIRGDEKLCPTARELERLLEHA